MKIRNGSSPPINDDPSYLNWLQTIRQQKANEGKKTVEIDRLISDCEKRIAEFKRTSKGKILVL